MKKALTIGFLLAAGLSAAHADTLRCGSKLIMEGDPAGKVLWFDLEYSPTTRRDLTSAIRVSLGQ